MDQVKESVSMLEAAQKIADEYQANAKAALENARKEAEGIIEEARESVTSIVTEGEEESARIVSEAERTSERLREDAENVLEAANKEVEGILRELKEDAKKLEERILDLRAFEDSYRVALTSSLNSYLEILKSSNESNEEGSEQF